MRKYFSHFQASLQKHRLTFAISFSILFAILLTIVSMALYNITGTASLDLSRPGYEVAIKQLKKNDTPSGSSFFSDNSLDAKVMEQYLKSYQKQSDALKSYGDFNEKALDDAQIGLNFPTPAESPPPPMQ